MARTPSAEYLILDIETVPDVERWKRPDVTQDTGAPRVDPAAAPAVAADTVGAPAAVPVDIAGAPAAVPAHTVGAPAAVPAAHTVGAPAAVPAHTVGAPAVPPVAPAGTPERQGRPDRAGFPPTWAHRIVVIGCLWLDHGYRLKRFGVIGDPTGGDGSPDQRERNLLEDFSRFVGRARPVLVTYNGRSFDLPVIALRALCHGIPLGWYYRERNVRYRYSDEGHLDLCDWLADHGATRSGSLDALTRLIGLPGKTGVDGSQVEGLYHSGGLGEIQRYCLADVAQTALLFLRFRLLQGVLKPDAYQDATRALLDALAADGRVATVLEGMDRLHLIGPPPPPS